MKKQTTTILSFLLLASSFVFAQTPAVADQDPKAKAILDDLSKTTKSYKTISAEYELILLNKEKKQTDKQSGKIQVKGNKYKLEIPGNTIVCDGKTVWTYNKDAQEVSIKNFEPNSEEGLNPSNIFTLYETGYKYKYEKEEKIGANTYHVINLYPAVKPEKKKFSIIKLFVEKTKKQVGEIKMMMKDGGTQTYEIKSFTPNAPLADTVFAFDTKSFKADQIVDERDSK
ncbi:MAG TPA: outer membrane lipoprotein carrier protein LolA [Bacteroidia bacterium]|jgi:outer membrane lipoprotein-sorting protein|nr:outer membrane lipoprotein carrier protein LolA [Bacteroidia bacterium]